MFHVVLNFEHESNADKNRFAAIVDELFKIGNELYNIWIEMRMD